MPLDRGDELVLGRRARRRDRRHDPAALRVELLVRRTGRTERELVDAVPGEACVRMAVDEARDRAPSSPVELDDVAVERAELTHRADADDLLALAEDERVLEHVDPAELGAARRSDGGRRGDELREVTDQEPAGAGRVGHPVESWCCIGSRTSCCAAAASASG